MAACNRLSWRIWLLAAGLALATALSRIPWRSHYLFAWDSANFALALDQYNVTFHQPQPPGYPLYVATAWLARLALRDANASYVALSILASAVAVLCLTLAAARLYDTLTAALAGVLLATSSVFWSQGEVAYPYAFLAAFGALVAWLCLELPLAQRSGALVVAIGAVLGVAAGFRTELAVFTLPMPGGSVLPLPIGFLVPLWLYAACRRDAPWRARLAAIAAGGVAMLLVVAAWYVPMVQRSGGWTAYQAATGSYYEYFIQTTSGAGRLLLGLLENTRALVGFLYNGLGLALLPMLYFLGRFFAPRRLVEDARARFLLLWLLPALAFYVTVHIGNPGYVLSVVPALCVYAARATLGLLEDVRDGAAALAARLGRRQPAQSRSLGPVAGPGTLAGDWPAALERLAAGRWVVPAAAAGVALMGLTNVALFRLGNGEGRYPEIRQIDRIFRRQLAVIREQYPPGAALIVAYDRSRQYHYYLPEYRIELLFNVAVAGAVTDTSRYWERRTTLTVPPGTSAVLFPDLERNISDQPGLVQRLDLGEGVELFVARVQPGDEVRYGYQYASAQRR